ncbi:MAG: efflux RND transporter periplasmic adaptor subunit [Desulfobacterales bacterium]|nr:efflux RND transporter periplasmic adaptor subunit [Deltaproteobacteria bacterium]NNK94388.1 efflux RND transporter periplasmic adaptor subunit [Desulfobacterales bacterium]
MTLLYIRQALLIVLIFTAVQSSGCKSDHSSADSVPKKLPAATVEVVTVSETAPPRQIEVMGTVQAADSASIAARVSGNIIELPVSLGSLVKKGDLLATISAEEITAKLLQAQAQLEQATRNLERERNLLKKNAATAETVKTLEESKRIAEASYKAARTMLSYTSIKAPFDGIITQKMANIGDLATPGKLLLKIENETRLQILADIPEALILELSIGDILPVNIPAAGLNIAGKITEIAPTADPRSRTAPVKLTIQPETKIRSGQFARVALPGTSGGAVMVPKSAVLSMGQLDRVFIVRDDTAHMQLVKTGIHHADMIEIISGINAGDIVISQGNSHLQDGQPIIIQ